MSKRQPTKGACGFCGREMTRSGLTRHIQTCSHRQETIAKAGQSSSEIIQPLYHLVVSDAYGGDYWLHLEINGQATLHDLDRYLRAIWLECCGHLSQFSVGGWRGKEIATSRKIAAVFDVGTELTHIYDFGTSSETLIKAVAVREGQPLTRHPIYLMARNHLPESQCTECGAVAGWYCPECLHEKGDWVFLCENHYDQHQHFEDEDSVVTPLVNSPRLGMCGYSGPAQPPY